METTIASLNVKNTVLTLGNMVASGATSIGVYTYYSSAEASSVAGPVQQKEARKVLFWYDPIYLNTHFDEPSKSLFMGMDLIPKYADGETADASSPGVHIGPTQTQDLKLRTEPMRRGPLHYTQIFPANVSYNKYQFVIVQVRSADFIEKVYPLTVGDKIKQGSPLIDLTIPDWVETQNEYLLLRETGGSATQVEGILEKLRLAGMPEADIRCLKSAHKIQTRLTLKAPIDGVTATFGLRTGMSISRDNVVAKIQGMNPVQVNASVPGSVTWLVKGASQFAITVPAWPDEPFTVSKRSILLSVDMATRTLQIRLQVDNPGKTLKPGMNTYLQLKAQSEPMLLIPSKTLIDTGIKQRVITADNEGRFVPKQVVIFHESQGLTVIRSDLIEDEKVVSNGLFPIDSETNISGVLDRMRVQYSKTQDVATMPAQATHSR